jgi:hypothetical protein
LTSTPSPLLPVWKTTGVQDQEVTEKAAKAQQKAVEPTTTVIIIIVIIVIIINI